MEYLLVLGIGIAAGVLGGVFGVGGGVLIVPALVLLVSMEQHCAVGTSLAALLPPVGLFGAFEYYRHGAVNIPYALLIALGIATGAYFGAVVAVKLSAFALRRAFAIFLALVAIRLLMA